MNKIFSILGPHAGETVEEVISKKLQDIDRCGYCLWFYFNTRLCNLQTSGLDNTEEVLFFNPKTIGGASDTKVNKVVRGYFDKFDKYISLPIEMSPVTGNINKKSCCFKLTSIVSYTSLQYIDVKEFEDIDKKHIVFNKYCSHILGFPRYVKAKERNIRSYSFKGVLDVNNPIVKIN